MPMPENFLLGFCFWVFVYWCSFTTDVIEKKVIIDIDIDKDICYMYPICGRCRRCDVIYLFPMKRITEKPKMPYRTLSFEENWRVKIKTRVFLPMFGRWWCWYWCWCRCSFRAPSRYRCQLCYPRYTIIFFSIIWHTNAIRIDWVTEYDANILRNSIAK